MVINRLDGINPLQDTQNAQKSQNRNSVRDIRDSINLSDEARELSEAYYASEVAKETPDVRADKIAEIKEKIKDPSYINEAVVNTVANRIMDAYGI
ncbi:MAG: flagellar biosynthesis anti-sigma factor FlgM [Treponemataceae bacterium]|nr:flagellar biosynthesis anti-sigma factor FlgM [Treponemataceae bacterium]